MRNCSRAADHAWQGGGETTSQAFWVSWLITNSRVVSAALIVAVHPRRCQCRSWTAYPVILPGLSLGLSSPWFGGTPEAAVVAQLALNLHVSGFGHLYERACP